MTIIQHPTHTVREAARLYLELGLRPIPYYGVTAAGHCTCGAGHWYDQGKHPIDQRWSDRGYPYSVADFPADGNIGLAMGKQPNGLWLVGLDFDLDARGLDALGEMPPIFRKLPRTLTTMSPHGLHAIFSVPEDTPLGNWVDVLYTKRDLNKQLQLDLKYCRGALIAGPSRVPAGGQYVTALRPITPLPEEVLRFIFARRSGRGTVAHSWRASHKGDLA
jgi:hypothetical protein